jgi:hypothetical protein
VAAGARKRPGHAASLLGTRGTADAQPSPLLLQRKPPAPRPAGDLPCGIGVTAAPGERKLIGMAFEAVWRLVVGGRAIVGRYAAFVELPEEA